MLYKIAWIRKDLPTALGQLAPITPLQMVVKKYINNNR
jgi:hypothetical protein